MSAPVVSVVLPARDEAASVARVIAEVHAALEAVDHEILVVDDGSTDGTGRRAREAGAMVLRLDGAGYGAAVKAGARAARGTFLAILDADGSYPADALPPMLAAVRAGARQAIGARPAFGEAEPWVRSAVKGAYRAAVRWAGGLAVPDLNSGMRVLRRRDLLALAPLLPDRFSLTTTLTLALAAEGDAPVFAPITYGRRSGRSKWKPVRDTWLMGRTVWRGIGWLREGRAPLALPAAEGAR